MTVPRVTRSIAWLGSAALIILTGRATGYALAPGPLARTLQQQAGGPGLPIVTLVSLGAAFVVATAICWLAGLGVRERLLLERRLIVVAPRLRPLQVLRHAVVLWVATSLAFACLESYLHWRAGLGWHGVSCLVGPVHRTMLPILGALSLVAAAILAALEHVVAWMRRTFALLRRRRPRFGLIPRLTPSAARQPLFERLCAAPVGARAPPFLS